MIDNKKRPADKFSIKSAESILGEDFNKEIENNKLEVGINQLHDFINHPFMVKDDEKMQELKDSIMENGIINPILVRKDINDSDMYEIISGHRRVFAAKALGLQEVPVTIKDLTDEDAAIIMVDSNIQREEVAVSEKAKAYKMKMEAMQRKGKKGISRIDTTSELGELSGDSRKQVSRYIRLSYLIDEILELIDKKKIPAFTTGYALAFLLEHEQIYLYSLMVERNIIPSKEQAEKMKKISLDGRKTGAELTSEMIEEILSEDKKSSSKKKNLDINKFRSYFPQNTSIEDMEKVIIDLLENWEEMQKKK